MRNSQIIANMNSRRACILKKSRELSVLCDIKVCALIVDPNGGKFHTWPENHVEAIHFLKQFKNNGEKKKKQKQKQNAVAAGNGQTDERKSMDFSCFDDKLIDGLSRDSVIEISNMLKSKIEAARNRAEFLKKMKEMTVRNEGFQNINPTPNFEPNLLFNGNPNFDPNFYFPQFQSTLPSIIGVPDSYFGQEQIGSIGLGNDWNSNCEPEIIFDYPPPLSYLPSFDNGFSNIRVPDYPQPLSYLPNC